MPIYEYECSSCNRVTEVIQAISDAPLEICPDCSGSLTKLVSMSSFQLKGGGWYADGYSGGACKKNGNGAGTCPASTPSSESSSPAVTLDSSGSASAPKCGAGNCCASSS